MRGVTIDPAKGFDTSVDTRVAPQGAIARVENMRVDKAGRLVLRDGYTSLGVTVSHGTGPLVPFDLYAFGDTLVAAGNSSPGQTGIRALYRYTNQAGTSWRGEHASQSSGDTSVTYRALPAADSIRVLLSSLVAEPTDVICADCAALSDGTAVAMVDTQLAAQQIHVTVINPTTGRVVKMANNPVAGLSPRLLAIGTVFYLFYQTGTTVEVRTISTVNQTTISAATVIATGTSAAPLAYDVASYEGSTDYLIAYPTGTGYTWRRFNSAHVQQTTTNVASLANAKVSICGATGENISVVNIRAASGAELRTFTAATGVVAVGPTNLDTSGSVMDWVGLCRYSATQVYYVLHRTATSSRTYKGTATIAAHVLAAESDADDIRAAAKPITIDGEVFSFDTLGIATANPYGFTRFGPSTSVNPEYLSGIVADGAAKNSYSAETIGQSPQIAKGIGSNYFVALVTFDPRDKTYRANLVAFAVNSGARRQGVVIGDNLATAGGTVQAYDGRVSVELGFETTPKIVSLTPATGLGLLTLLGVYTYQLVYRSVASNGDVSQSGPSAPLTVTLVGANNQVTVLATNTFSVRRMNLIAAQGGAVYLDVYRTEAGGSIPRLVRSFDLTSFSGYGAEASVSDLASDAVQQTGSVLYTQGADGSVSGRLPLGLASPGTLVAEADGRLMVGGLERRNQLQLSVEGRPGESIGFVNDDLFFVTNPEPVTAIVSGDDGRRFIFSASNIRELVGQGPNSAGVGDISEPVEIENRVGAVDWRSVAKTEHGVFFQSSAFGEPRIYLLPRGGSSAMDASEGARDVLRDYPVITSATRHDEEQLLTFTLQNAAGTDGRILHLDLKSSGMGRNGWQGRWIVDRVAAFESVQFPYIVEERVEIFQVVAGQSVLVDEFRGIRVGDREIAVTTLQVTDAVGVTSITSYTQRTTAGGATFRTQVFEKVLSVPAFTGIVSNAISLATATFVGPATLFVKRYLIRGAHPSTVCEVTGVTIAAALTWTLPPLTPTWGSAKNLFLASAHSDLAFADPLIPVIRTFPANYGGVSRAEARDATSALQLTGDSAYCSRQNETATESGASFATTFASTGAAWLIGIRPAVIVGTPIRASSQYRGRLVVCNATDVLASDPAAAGDLGSTVIMGEWESADIYPMGSGGAGRHLGICIMGELLGFCQLVSWFSYDGGVNWTGLRQYALTPTNGYSLGKVLQLQWVPKRRKVERVRVKLTIADESLLPSGATRGIALNQLVLWFEDLAGPSRVATSKTTGYGGRQ